MPTRISLEEAHRRREAGFTEAYTQWKRDPVAQQKVHQRREAAFTDWYAGVQEYVQVQSEIDALAEKKKQRPARRLKSEGDIYAVAAPLREEVFQAVESPFQEVEVGLQTTVETQQAKAEEKAKDRPVRRLKHEGDIYAGGAERLTSLAATAAKEVFRDITLPVRPVFIAEVVGGISEMTRGTTVPVFSEDLATGERVHIGAKRVTAKEVQAEVKKKAVAEAKADPVRTAVAVAANIIGAPLLARAMTKVTAAKATHLIGLDVDTIPTGRLVDVVDPFTGKAAKAFVSPETVLKGVTESKIIPKKMTDLLEDLIPKKGTVDLLTTRTGGDIGDIGRIGLQADEVLDLVKGKDVTLPSGLDMDTILVGRKTGFEVLDDTAPLLGGDPFPTAVDIFAMEAKELGPSLSVEEIAFGGKFFDEGVTGLLDEGQFKFEVKGAVIEDVPDIAKDFISKIEPGVGDGIPFAVDFQQPGYTDSLRNIGKGLKSDIDIVKKLTGGEFVGPSGGFEDLIGLQQKAGRVTGTPFLIEDIGVSASSIAALMGAGLAVDLGIRLRDWGGETLKIGEVPDILLNLGKVQLPDFVQDTTPIIVPDIVPDIVPKITPVVVPDITPIVVPKITPIVVPTITPVVVPKIIPVIIPQITPIEDLVQKPPPTFGFPSLISGIGKRANVMDFVFGPAKRKGQKQLYTGEQRRFLEADVKKILKRMGF